MGLGVPRIAGGLAITTGIWRSSHCPECPSFWSGVKEKEDVLGGRRMWSTGRGMLFHPYQFNKFWIQLILQVGTMKGVTGGKCRFNSAERKWENETPPSLEWGLRGRCLLLLIFGKIDLKTKGEDWKSSVLVKTQSWRTGPLRTLGMRESWGRCRNGATLIPTWLANMAKHRSLLLERTGVGERWRVLLEQNYISPGTVEEYTQMPLLGLRERGMRWSRWSCWDRTRSIPTQLTHMVKLCSSGLSAMGMRESWAYCWSGAKSNPTELTKMAERSSHSLVRLGMTELPRDRERISFPDMQRPCKQQSSSPPSSASYLNPLLKGLPGFDI